MGFLFNLLIKIVLPAILLTIIACSSSDSGSSRESSSVQIAIDEMNSINNSNESSYNFSGSCKGPGLTGRFQFSNVGGANEVTGEITCNGQNWQTQANLSNLNDGDITLEIFFQGETLDPVTISKDTNLPTFVLDAVSDYITESSLDLSGNCSEDGDISITVGDFLSDTTSCVQGHWDFTVSFSGQPDANYSITVDFSDLAGNATPQQTADTTLDTIVPTLSLDDLASINAASGANYNLEGNCSEDGEEVTVAVNGQAISSQPTCSSGRWMAVLLISSLPEGTIGFTVDHQDLAGNSAPQIQRSILKDTSIPQLAASNHLIVPPNGTFGTAQNLDFVVVFSESVIVDTSSGTPSLSLVVGANNRMASYVSGSGSSSLAFRYTITSRESDNDGIQLATGNTVALNSGIIHDAAGNNWVPAAMTVPSLALVLVDAFEPTVTMVTATQGQYTSGVSVVLTAAFDQAVIVSGIPQLTLAVGSGTAQADFSGTGSSSTTHDFTYTVGSSDNGALSVTAINLDGGSIVNGSGVSAVTSLGAALNVTGVIADTINPVVMGLADDSVTTASKTWTWSCQDASSCTYRHVINQTSSHSFSSESYDSVTTASQSTGTGIYYLHVQARDGAGNESQVVSVSAELGAGDGGGNAWAVAIDTPDPINSDNESAYSVSGTCSSHSGEVTVSVGGSTPPVQPQCSSEAWSTSVDTTEVNDDPAVAITVSFGSGGYMVSDSGTVLKDTSVPQLATNNHLSVPSDTTYGTSQNLDFIVTFSESVLVDTRNGTPSLSLVVGANNRMASYVSGSGSSSLTFRYTITSGESDNDGIQLATGNTVALNSGIIHDVAGNNWVLAAMTVPSLALVLVDAFEPTVTMVTTTQGQYTSGVSVVLTATFDQAVTVSGIPQLTLAVGSGTAQADFSGAGSSSTTHDFTYTVGSSDNGALSVTAINLDGGSIVNGSSVSAVTSLGAALNVTGVIADTINPVVTGLADDSVTTASKTWTWSCQDASSCTYRHVINQTSSHSFSSESYDSVTTASQSTGTGIYYLHVQARDGAGNESQVVSVSAELGAGDSGGNAWAVAIDTPDPINSDNESAYSVSGTCSSHSGEVTVSVGGSTPPVQPQCSSEAWSTSVDTTEVNDDPAVAITVSFGSGGDMVSDSGTILKDTVVPTVAITAPDPATEDNVAVYPLSGTCSEDGREVTVSVDSLSPAPQPICSSGAWSVQLDISSLGVGTFAAQASHTDMATNSEGALQQSIVRMGISLRFFSQVISSGAHHSCALVSGQVKCWGQGSQGQLGGGGTLAHRYPITVVEQDSSTLSGIVQVSLGAAHSCGIDDQGMAWCWGRGAEGQLGDEVTDTPAQEEHPIAVVDSNGDAIGGLIQISAGEDHSCGLLSSGRVMCWGAGGHGQLGNNATSDQDYPVSVVNSNGDVLSGFVQISAGDDHTCGLKLSGKVQCWGRGVNGVLGNGQNSDSGFPVTVQRESGDSNPLEDVISVSSGSEHVCALLESGSIKCWGNGEFGRLGDGDLTDHMSSSPINVRNASNTVGSTLGSIAQISAGGQHTCAVSASGDGFCWGSGDGGRLGDGTTVNRGHPASITILDTSNSDVSLGNISQISAGGRHACATTLDGQVWCWGLGEDGRLGNDDSTHANQVRPALVVDRVSASQSLKIAAYHRDYICASAVPCSLEAITASFTGGPSSLGNESSPSIQISGISTGQTVTLYSDSACSTSVGTATQDSDTVSLSSLAEQAHQFYFTVTELLQVSNCSHSFLAYTLDSTVPAAPTLSLPSSSGDDPIPDVEVSGLNIRDTIKIYSDSSCQAVAASPIIAVGSSATVSVFALDANGSYEFYATATDPAGNVSSCSSSSSGAYAFVISFTAFSMGTIDAGGLHSCAIKSDKTVSCWGKGTQGQLGDGQGSDSYAPVTVVSEQGDSNDLSDTIQISAGENHSCTLNTSGNIKCWGRGSDGQLGDGLGSGSNIPVTVISGEGSSQPLGSVVQISSGNFYTCALKSDSTVSCWGANEAYQLGRANTTVVSILHPTVVISDQSDSDSLSGVVQISAGGTHSCALLSDGRIKCWGDGGDGRLGDGTTTSRTYPAFVLSAIGSTTPLGDIIQVSSGVSHTCALKSDGTVSCWGEGTFGQLGHGLSTSSYYPVTVISGMGSFTALGSVIQIASGDYYSCALKSDGTVSCWGSELQGRLGNASSISSNNFPVDVVAGEGSSDLLNNVIQISAGKKGHTCAQITTGEVKCWGVGDSGQLGEVSLTVDRECPVTVIADLNTAQWLNIGTYQRSYDCIDQGSLCDASSIELSLTSANPSPNSSDDAPDIEVVGISPGQTLTLYSDRTCGTSVGTALTADGTISLAGLSEGKHRFYFQVTGRQCSQAAISYVLDQTAPSVPGLSLPIASGLDTTPNVMVTGLTPGDLVNIFSDVACSTQAAIPTRVHGVSTSGITVSEITGGAGPYDFYAQATDLAGNSSACSTVATYTLQGF